MQKLFSFVMRLLYGSWDIAPGNGRFIKRRWTVDGWEYAELSPAEHQKAMEWWATK